jgi:hypothetical protein
MLGFEPKFVIFISVSYCFWTTAFRTVHSTLAKISHVLVKHKVMFSVPCPILSLRIPVLLVFCFCLKLHSWEDLKKQSKDACSPSCRDAKAGGSPELQNLRTIWVSNGSGDTRHKKTTNKAFWKDSQVILFYCIAYWEPRKLKVNMEHFLLCMTSNSPHLSLSTCW